MNRNLLAIATIVIGASLASGSGHADASGARQFIQTAAERTFNSLGLTEIENEERDLRFRTLLTDTFDLRTIARFTLGRYWRRASTEQKTEYVSLFEEFVVLAYSNRFRDLTGKQFRINKVSALDEEISLVVSEIIMPDRPPVRVNWRVRLRDGTYKVTDVAVEGISMSVTQRDEFASVIRSSGGRVEGLLRALRRKTGRD